MAIPGGRVEGDVGRRRPVRRGRHRRGKTRLHRGTRREIHRRETQHLAGRETRPRQHRPHVLRPRQRQDPEKVGLQLRLRQQRDGVPQRREDHQVRDPDGAPPPDGVLHRNPLALIHREGERRRGKGRPPSRPGRQRLRELRSHRPEANHPLAETTGKQLPTTNHA